MEPNDGTNGVKICLVGRVLSRKVIKKAAVHSIVDVSWKPKRSIVVSK